MTTSLTVNEIFFSIQGESSYAGRPCAFVRLTYCNLRCNYCDTEYAFYEGREMPVEAIVAEILKYPTALVEVTGGEPLLQEGVHTLCSDLLDRGKTVLIETGGSLDISRVDPRVTLIYDIKCPDSLMADQNRWENLQKLRRQDEIKFVIQSRHDYDWSKAKIREFALTDHQTVLFSPVWNTLPPKELARWILEDGLPVRLQLQVHKVLWGEKRGV